MKAGNKPIWVLIALLTVAVAMQGILIAKLYRTEDMPEPIKQSPPVQMDRVPETAANSSHGTAPPGLPQSPIDPFDGFGFDPDTCSTIHSDAFS
jgi:hypothetical protein